LEFIPEPENRVATVISPTLLKLYYRREYRSGVSSIFATDENVAPTLFGYIMKTHLKEIVSLKLSHLNEAGIFSHTMKPHFMKDFESKPEEIGPQVLRLHHLAAGFVVILFLLIVSVAVFAVEVLPNLWKSLLSWPGKAVFCFAVVKFTKMNKLM
jgi:hypothetical protein